MKGVSFAAHPPAEDGSHPHDAHVPTGRARLRGRTSQCSVAGVMSFGPQLGILVRRLERVGTGEASESVRNDRQLRCRSL